MLSYHYFLRPEIASAVVESRVIAAEADFLHGLFAAALRFNFIFAIEAAEVEPAAYLGAKACVPFAVDKLVERLVRRLFGKVLAQEARMVEVFVAYGGLVRKVPPYDGAHASLGEPEAHKSFCYLCLKLLVALVVAVGGERDFRNVNRQAKRAVALERVQKS